MADQKTDDLAALRAQVEAEEAEADSALSPEDAERAELAQRSVAARERTRSKKGQIRTALMLARLDAARKVANGAYVVEILDAEAQTDGAGAYLVRSPDRASWNELREAIQRAGSDADKIERAYRNLSNKCMIYPKLGADVSGEEMSERYDKYTSLATSIGDFAGTLGGVAAGQRKR